MKMNYFKILIFITLSLFFVACNAVTTSDKVSQRVIFPSYSVLYDASTQTLYAMVTFQLDNESGSYIKLSKNSSVLINQETMKFGSVEEKPSYYYYEQKEMSDCPDKVSFNYTNDEGDEFFNQLKIRTIKISDLKLKKGQDTSVKYVGTAIDEDETITLVLSKDNVQQYEIEPEVADNNLLVVPEYLLSDIKADTYEAYLLRTTYSTSVKAMDRGGSAETSYHSKSYKITIQ